MNVRYRVELNQSERDEVTGLLSGGKQAARKLKRAQILLAADAGASDEDIAISVAVGGSTVYRTKRRFVEGNLEAALNEEPRPGAERKLSGKEEALLVATACSSPPKGRARWTLELLAGAMVQLTEHEGLSRETVRRRLVENDLKPWRKDMWCIPQVDGTYVARMEDVLDLYAEAPDPGARWSASTRARSSSSARSAGRSRPSRGKSSVNRRRKVTRDRRPKLTPWRLVTVSFADGAGRQAGPVSKAYGCRRPDPRAGVKAREATRVRGLGLDAEHGSGTRRDGSDNLDENEGWPAFRRGA